MIPEDKIMVHLDMLLGSSDPGDSLHHLHVVAAPPGVIGPFGLPDEKRLETTIYAIAPTQEVDVQRFTARVIQGAAAEAAEAGLTPLFAALSQEVWTVERDHYDEEARRLMEEGRLGDHPDMVEVTVVYGACRDGRRWRGRRWLTGPKAGTTEDVELLVGRPQPSEGGDWMPCAPLVRRLVGVR